MSAPVLAPAVPSTADADPAGLEQPTTILDFPLDLLASLLLRLAPRDIATCACSCTRLRLAGEDDALIWRDICEKSSGEATNVSSWLQLDDAWPGAGPTTYRQLYPILQQHHEYIGLWKAMGGGPRGSVFSFRWGPDCVEVLQLLPEPCWRLRVPSQLQYKLGPGYGRYSAEVVDRNKCLLREQQRNSPGPSNSAAAEAAAAVALGGGISGSSPTTAGFGYEFMRFMQGSLQQGRGSRKSKRPGCSGGSSSLVQHHFVRLPLPQSTRQHPLAGAWKGLYGPHGLELSLITYDFGGPSARIVCTKVLGDKNVPAGEITWYAQAAPLVQPWPERVQQEVEQQAVLEAAARQAARYFHILNLHGDGAIWAGVVGVDEEEEEEGGLVDIGELIHQQQQQQQGGQGQEQGRRERGSSGSSRVVAVHVGKGRVAQEGFVQPAWMEGQLWVYEDGHVSFLWLNEALMGGGGFLVEYSRVEEGLLPQQQVQVQLYPGTRGVTGAGRPSSA